MLIVFLEHTILIALGRFKELFEDIPKNVIYNLTMSEPEHTGDTEDFPDYTWTVIQTSR